jgi:hypothetical protein
MFNMISNPHFTFYSYVDVLWMQHFICFVNSSGSMPTLNDVKQFLRQDQNLTPAGFLLRMLELKMCFGGLMQK